MTNPSRLPEGFEDLEPFVDDWALETEEQRHRKQLSATLASLRAFYDAVLPRSPAMIAHLNRFPLDQLPAAEAALFNLGASFFETAHVIELGWKSTDINHPPACRFAYRR